MVAAAEAEASSLRLREVSKSFPAPDDAKAQKELAGILTSLEGDYGRGKWCPDGDAKPCLDITKIERLLATSRDPEKREQYDHFGAAFNERGGPRPRTPRDRDPRPGSARGQARSSAGRPKSGNSSG